MRPLAEASRRRYAMSRPRQSRHYSFGGELSHAPVEIDRFPNSYAECSGPRLPARSPNPPNNRRQATRCQSKFAVRGPSVADRLDALFALSGPSLSLRSRRKQSRTCRRQSRGGMGAGGSFGPPALQRGGSVVLEPADQQGGDVVGGYLAGQPDVDLDRRMVIRANVNGVGPAEDHQPDRLTDQQAGQIGRAAGADWPGGIERAQPPCPALIDADDSSAVARSPDWGGRNQLTQRFQFVPSCRSFIGLALCTGHPPIRGGHLPAAGAPLLPFLPSRRSLVGLVLCTGFPAIYPMHHAWLPSPGMASRPAIRALAAAAERLQATARCRLRTHRKTWRLFLGGCTGGGRVS